MLTGSPAVKALPSVTLRRGSEERRHVMNPYTGEDVGEAFTEGEAWVQWLENLHDAGRQRAGFDIQQRGRRPVRQHEHDRTLPQ